MNGFLKAEQLKKQYVVYGSFYQLKISSIIILPCRNRLEIFDRSAEIQSLRSDCPDALAIMMNPGSSAPLETASQLPEYSSKDLQQTAAIPVKWVLAKPDITQYQIMRVMQAKGWRYTRVLNLSDIREPKSKVFQVLLEHLQSTEPLQLHSIFCKSRSQELQNALELKDAAPVILAWGADRFLIELANLCFNSADIKNAKGIACDKNRLLYSHASPTLQQHKERWLENILKIV
jgi:hypothetical protein